MYRFLFFFTLLCGSFINAQNKELLYDFTDIPQALLLNPGMQTDFQWYAGIPGVSGISFQAGSSGVTVNDLFAEDGIDFNQKVRERLIHGVSSRDDLSGTYQIELLSGGFRGRNPTNFYSFGIYNEGDAIGYWFKDYAILGFEGNADYIGDKFNLGHLKTRGEILNVFHFGINKKVNRELTLGGRAKIYSSAVNFSSTKNRGYYITEKGENNLLANTIDADMEFRSSGMEEIYRAFDEDRDRIPGILTKRLFFGGNLGVGVDFGFSYQLNAQTVVTGSVLDLGFIYNSSNVRNYTLKGQATVEGVEVVLPDAFAPNDTDFWKELVDKVEKLVPFNQNRQGYISFRPTKLYGSLRYNFGKALPSRENCGCDYRYASYRGVERYVNAVGAQLYAINRPRGPQAALTAFYMRRLGNSLALKTTYTIDKFSFSNIGLGLNVQAGPVNFYVMADNLLALENLADSHYTSFQLGLNIITWGKK
ncbi:hypothetical protein SAMN04487911_10755 [Arenibacter nanhaiticus]|uniref:DUF5723 domain-containing protein n=1 Tax=Arenibacter nanhaiticus TaxID=558155 RepID=A0A1M6EUK7_9FLAO|nr:DUF5723 family protein [Arenibacter nanhaiticus]SHI89076.1 hypothetical protein SAMN04487911_10755 [Arenibacter nanhaiticus]